VTQTTLSLFCHDLASPGLIDEVASQYLTNDNNIMQRSQVSLVKLAWCAFILGTLHLLWMADGVAAIYLANQDFKM
jgi:hypothetical protein